MQNFLHKRIVDVPQSRQGLFDVHNLTINVLRDLRSKFLTANVVLMNRKLRPTTPLPRDGRCSLRSGRRHYPRRSYEEKRQWRKQKENFFILA